MILSVPLELNNDHEELFSIASQRSSCVSEKMMSELYGWPRERFYRVVNVLLQEGIVWLDSTVLDTEGLLTCMRTCITIEQDRTEHYIYTMNTMYEVHVAYSPPRSTNMLCCAVHRRGPSLLFPITLERRRSQLKKLY